MSILLRILGSILVIYGVAHIIGTIGTSSSYTPYLLLFIFPGLAVLWVDSEIKLRKEKQDSGHQSNKKSNKALEIVDIIAKAFQLAVGIFMLIFLLSFFIGGNLGPINGVILGSIVSLPLFVLLLVAWILRAQGFTKMRAYSIAFAGICLIPFGYFVVAYTIHLGRSL